MIGFKLITEHSSSGGPAGALARTFLRFLQFCLGLAVCGLYGQDLSAASQAGVYMDAKWVYAVTVGGIAASTCILYLVIHFMSWIKSHHLFSWDAVIFILWVALFGIFGKIYISANPTPEQHGQWRMKRAVWVDLVNMLLWFVSAVWGGVVFWKARRGGKAGELEKA
ncbi:hypothetical protein K431DRAFT_281279 [Polychaeton citri CBS 116435]|uniref:MARVEL domain-containing protein n=1 Tax=Polychaeton citri CBS 116435 TaxID=1314669 RepID=A0A9P4USS1_9PEZI|nr:hypothetical protein K431DRAFT_281279 [Polychaeton citri CBS 116435]